MASFYFSNYSKLICWILPKYYNGTQCAQCNESCFTCDSSTGCTSCTSFMYLNTTTGLCQYCSYGFYYDETLRGCRDCTGICTGACGYQSICFQCSSGQIYDTDLMKCVDTCIFPKVLHNDSQYSVRSVCRSSSFYIDSQSQSIIELGTKMHPFRFFKSALSEILNQYSHSNNSISVYVKENTELSITTNIAYLMNITSVSIKSYSNTSNSPKNANLIMSEQIQSQSIKTLFNILSNNNLQLDKVISQSQFNSNEVAIATQGNIIFSITRSNFSISNMTILSNSVFDQVFINCASAEIKQINIRDIYFNASGHILNVLYPTNAFIKNVIIEASRLENGFMFNIPCNYPEAILTNEVVFDNITAFYAQPKATYEWPRIIYYQGPGNITATNLDFEGYYSSYSDYKSTIFITTSQICQPNDDSIQKLFFDTVALSLQNYSIGIPLFNGIDASLQFSIYRRKMINLSNFSYTNFTTSAGPIIYLSGYQTDKFYYSNSYHSNLKSQSELILVETFNTVEISNVYFENNDHIKFPIFDLSYINNLSLNNITFNNMNNTSRIKNTFISLNNYESTVTQILKIKVSNCFTNSGAIISSQTLLDKISISNAYFTDINTEANSNLIIVEFIKSLDFQNFTLQNIFCNDLNDENSKFLLVSELNIDGDQNSTIQNVLFTNSTVSFMNVQSIFNNSTVGYFFNVINVTITGLVFSQPKSIIQFSKFSERVNLTFAFDSCLFSNIHFDYNGILFLLGGRMYTPVIISNSAFYNLTSASIHLRPQEISDSTIIDQLNINNCTFDRINSIFDSFIVAFEHGFVTINKCSFTNMYSYETAAVMFGGYDDTVFLIFDSIFQNCTSVQASVLIFDNYAVVEVTNSTFENNFALSSGFVQVNGGSQVTFTSCIITNNFAIANPIAVVFEGYSSLIFSNCLIYNNLALTKDQVDIEFNTRCYQLCFIPDTFKNYINKNSGLLSIPYSEAAINSVYSFLSIINGTIVKNQNTLISSIISEIIIEDSLLTNITVTKGSNLSLVSSTLSMTNVTITGVENLKGFDFIQSIENCTINIALVEFTNSNSNFLNAISTQVQLKNATFSTISSSRPILSVDQSSDNILDGVTINNCTLQSKWVIKISNCDSSQLNLITIQNLDKTAVYIYNSNISVLQNCLATNNYQAFLIEKSVISQFKDSILLKNGNSLSQYGGAIRLIDSNISISNLTFRNNEAQSGASISFECKELSNCNLNLERSMFDSNIAFLQGGAIYYNYKRPKFSQNIFLNNQALYGVNIASYAVKIRFYKSNSDQMNVFDIASGMKYEKELTFELLDYDDQIMVLNNFNQIEMNVINSSQLIFKGENSALLKNGIATFRNFIAISKPGNTMIPILIKCKAIEEKIYKTVFGYQLGSNILYANFRFCMPGEIQMNGNTCSQCAAGTYSFLWNSTICNQCLQNSVCLGLDKISLDSGYWRNTKNSTFIAECLNRDACKGEFSDNKHPINCNTGYSGILCNDCDISNGVKYQRVSDFECQKCPTPIYNAIRVIGLILLVFTFLMILIIINIRKTKDSEISILIRIITNYLQLLTTSISFNINYPSTLLNVLSPASQIGSSSQTFLSFDCFITNSQIKGPFSSNTFFKLFMTGILPLILISIISTIWICVWFIKPSLIKDLKRSIAISFISIVFFLHPKLASSSVSIFECVEIDNNIYKVRINTNMDCYSSEHILWCFYLGVTIILFWVIGLPLFALYLLSKNINKEESNRINMYFLILYQGLKRNRFYWEFANSLRKMLILVIFAALSTISPVYKIIASIIILIVSARIQIKLKPYKNQQHSKIEMLGVISGTMTLFSGLIYTSSSSVPTLDMLILAFIFFVNIIFILEWTLLFLNCLSERYSFLHKVTFFFKLVLCKKIKTKENKTVIKNSKRDCKTSSHKSIKKKKKEQKAQAKKAFKKRKVKHFKRFESSHESSTDKEKQTHLMIIDRGEIDEVVIQANLGQSSNSSLFREKISPIFKIKSSAFRNRDFGSCDRNAGGTQENKNAGGWHEEMEPDIEQSIYLPDNSKQAKNSRRQSTKFKLGFRTDNLLASVLSSNFSRSSGK